MDLQKFMADNLRGLVATAYKSVLTTPHEARFALQLQKILAKGERRRKEIQKKEGLEVPPFLIASIATECNLKCKGCYARKVGIASEESTKPTLTADEWHNLFAEAAGMGFNVALLAGGEPLTRRDVLERVTTVKDILFPVFTNGTMIGAVYTQFFKKNLNMVPVISLEGDAGTTDTRRGRGVYERALKGMEMLHSEGLFFGTSITVTTENKALVTSKEYIESLRALGCKMIFYVEYVPIDEGTEHLAFGDEDVQWMERTLEERRTEYTDLIFVSFPGDEKLLDGCMAAGRGFFHIGPDGAAEPCPFSPHSDTNAAHDGLRAALRSPLFMKIRDARVLGWDHTGGCTLYEHRSEVDAMMAEG